MTNLFKPHHEKYKICTTRASYRDGKKGRAVKAYNILKESRYLLVQRVPALKVITDLIKVFALYGNIEEYKQIEDYPCELFQIAVWIKYSNINESRIAKKKMDDFVFFGNPLHVCYAPEYETLEDLEAKLEQRRDDVHTRIRINARDKHFIDKRATSKLRSFERVTTFIDEIEEDEPLPEVSETSDPSEGPAYEPVEPQFSVPYPSMIPDIHHPAVAQGMAAANMTLQSMTAGAPIPSRSNFGGFTPIEFSRSSTRGSGIDVMERLDDLAKSGGIQIRKAPVSLGSSSFMPRQLKAANQALRTAALKLGKRQGPSKQYPPMKIEVVENSSYTDTICNIRNTMNKVPNEDTKRKKLNE